MALNADALVTLEEAKAQLKKQEGDNADDEFIEGLVNQASDFCVATCGRTFDQTTATDKLYDGYGTEILLLDWPVVTLTSLYSDSMRLFPSATQLTEWNPSTGTGHFLLNKEAGTVTRIDGSLFPYGVGVIKATLEYGFAVIPGPIKRGVLLLIDKWFDERETSAKGQIESETIGSYSVDYAVAVATGNQRDPLLQRVLDVWQPYIISTIAGADRPHYTITV